MFASSLSAFQGGRPEPAPAAGDLSALVAACRAGDQAAWRRLVTSRAAQVFRWAVLLGLRPAEAEDAAQEVFLVAARRIGTCRTDLALSSWLFQVTRRVCANHRRRGWWRRWLGLASVEGAAAAAAFASPAGAAGPAIASELAVRACLRRLSPRLAEVLVLLEVEGLTREEAAVALGVPPGTVASRLRLARRAFERLWNEENDSAHRPPGERQ